MIPIIDHYYTRDPKSEHDTKEIRADIRGRTFLFATDTSVFSRRALDYGTHLLLTRLPLPLEGAVLDVGCGYGPIGITVATFSPHARVTMVDVNVRALALSRANARRNGVPDVEVLESDSFSAIADRRFRWIVTNPPIRAGKQTVYGMFREASEHLEESGEFWLVIRKKQGASSAFKYLQTLFTEVNVVSRDKGYHIICCEK